METEKTVYHCALDWGCQTEKVAPMLYRAVSDCVGSFEIPYGYAVNRVVVRCVNSEKELYLFDIEYKIENNIVHFKIPKNTVFVNTFDMPVDVIAEPVNIWKYVWVSHPQSNNRYDLYRNDELIFGKISGDICSAIFVKFANDNDLIIEINQMGKEIAITKQRLINDYSKVYESTNIDFLKYPQL